MPFANRKIILEDLSSSVLPQFKKYHPSGNLKFNNLGISQSLKLRILIGKILPISKPNFTHNTSGCYGLINHVYVNGYNCMTVELRFKVASKRIENNLQYYQQT